MGAAIAVGQATVSGLWKDSLPTDADTVVVRCGILTALDRISKQTADFSAGCPIPSQARRELMHPDMCQGQRPANPGRSSVSGSLLECGE